MMYFNNDYSEGCHPRILQALTQSNLEQTPGYGQDAYCAMPPRKSRPCAAGRIWRCIFW